MKINGNSPVAATQSQGPVQSIKSAKGMDVGTPAGMNNEKQAMKDFAAKMNGNPVNGGRLVQGHGNPKLDKDAFFKLMLTQVKNQDPMNPLKEHEMAAQLAQFSSLEQMSNIHSVLGEMNKGQATNGQYQAMELIGKTISGDSGKIDRAGGEDKHPLAFVLKEAASEVRIAVRDAQGKVVKMIELKNQSAGPVKAEWDGKDIEGRSLPAGSYKIQVDAKSVDNRKVLAETQFKGQVTGIQFTDKGAVLLIGNKAVPLKDIKQIESEGQAQAEPVRQQKMMGAQQLNDRNQIKPQDAQQALAAMSQLQVAKNLNNNKF